MAGSLRGVVMVGTLLVLGCESKGSASSTSSGMTTGGTIDDPEAFCAQFEDHASCSFVDESQEVYCGWDVITPVSMDNDACVLGEPIGACRPLTGASTADGCGSPPGCDGEPFFIDLEGQVGVFFQCGGSAPIGGEPCTYVSPGVFEPPECGCLCDEPIDPSSSGGATSSTSTTG